MYLWPIICSFELTGSGVPTIIPLLLLYFIIPCGLDQISQNYFDLESWIIYAHGFLALLLSCNFFACLDAQLVEWNYIINWLH
jgi:hypothetical protein